MAIPLLTPWSESFRWAGLGRLALLDVVATSERWVCSENTKRRQPRPSTARIPALWRSLHTTSVEPAVAVAPARPLRCSVGTTQCLFGHPVGHGA